MDSAKYVNTTQEDKHKYRLKKEKKSKMCNKIKCAIQNTVDLNNNNISRDVQEECANRLYRVYSHSSNTDDGE